MSAAVAEAEEREFAAWRRATAADAAYLAAIGDTAWTRGYLKAAQHNWKGAGRLYGEAMDAVIGE